MARHKQEFNGMLDSDDEDSLDSKYEDTGISATVGRTALQRLLRRNSFQDYVMTPSSYEKGETKNGIRFIRQYLACPKASVWNLNGRQNGR